MSDKNRQTVSEDELHALVDGQLSAERQAQVLQWLDAHPQEKATVERWRAGSAAIRDLFREDDRDGEADRRLVAALQKRAGRGESASAGNWKYLRGIAAGVALFVSGGVVGYGVNAYLATQPTVYVETLPRASRTNYLVYASEVRHPVEVGADEEAHLVAWLGKRIGRKLAAPDLRAENFRLVGGRLVTFDGKPGAMLMYEDKAGDRLTVTIATSPSHKGTNFRFEQENGIGTFYWIDDGYGYALSGNLVREELLHLATAIYRQQTTPVSQ
ncbi:MAG: anti-sigma factor [Salaquimonas sp.]|jgi:anti-sigma factor RsiW|nr:anti-sigma factor [Salaquimonas sp.]